MSQIKKKLGKAYYVYIINDQKAELARIKSQNRLVISEKDTEIGELRLQLL